MKSIIGRVFPKKDEKRPRRLPAPPAEVSSELTSSDIEIGVRPCALKC